jgi:GNAT superfamily N-acetyltransferase
MHTSTTESGRSTRPRTSFRIAPAQRSDMTMIANFVRSSAEWYRPIVAEKDMGQHSVDETWADENFDKRDFYIGYADGKAVGTISLQFFEDHAYLGYIYLDVEHVGNGYGQKLMRFAERKSIELGMTGMALIAHPEATWAKRAYLKFGFDIIATDKSEVLSWKDGALVPYYEEGFHLYVFSLTKSVSSSARREIAHA